MQDCNISIANALEILQSCIKPSIWCHWGKWVNSLFQRTISQAILWAHHWNLVKIVCTYFEFTDQIRWQSAQANQLSWNVQNCDLIWSSFFMHTFSMHNFHHLYYEFINCLGNGPQILSSRIQGKENGPIRKETQYIHWGLTKFGRPNLIFFLSIYVFFNFR